MADRVVHFEATGRNGEALRDFYAKAFGWSFSVMPEMDYGVVDNGGQGIGGGVGGTGDEGRPAAVFYVAVRDPQATLDRAEKAGGRTAVPVTEIPGIVTFAQFTDPEGNLVGVVKDDGGETPPSTAAPAENPVTWFEIMGKDGARLRDFYADLFGWEYTFTAPGTDYGMVQMSDQIGGGVGSGDNAYAIWYVRVADPASVLTKIESLGGKTMQPATDIGIVTFGTFKDPEGNLVGVFKTNG